MPSPARALSVKVMATNQSSASGAAAVFRDVVEVGSWTAGPAAAAILR
jgi:hypothetical protein